MGKLEGQVALVTGASRGIGRAIAEQLAAEGATVALAARNEEELFQVAEGITAAGGKALVIRTDVSVEEQVVGMIAQTLEAFDRLDVVVNNAGVGVFGKLADTTTEQWDAVMDITLKGAYLVARETVKALVPRGGGLLINIGSDLSYRASEHCGIYGTAKYGVAYLTQVINREYRTQGVRCTGIYPGMIDTYFAGSKMGEERKRDWLKGADLADAVLYVASTPKHVRIDEIRLHPMVQDSF